MYTLEDVKKLKQSIPTQTVKSAGKYTLEDVKKLKASLPAQPPTQTIQQVKPIVPAVNQNIETTKKITPLSNTSMINKLGKNTPKINQDQSKLAINNMKQVASNKAQSLTKEQLAPMIFKDNLDSIAENARQEAIKNATPLQKLQFIGQSAKTGITNFGADTYNYFNAIGNKIGNDIISGKDTTLINIADVLEKDKRTEPIRINNVKYTQQITPELVNQLNNAKTKAEQIQILRAVGNREITSRQIQAKNLLKQTEWADKIQEETNRQAKYMPTGTKILGDATQVVTNMAPTLALSAVNPTVGMGVMGASAGGGAYKTAINNGATQNQALANANLTGAKEIATEMLFSSTIQKLAKIPGIDLSKWTSKISNKGLQAGAKLANDVIGEGAEEVISTFAQPYIDRMTYAPETANATLEEMIQAFNSSILPTLILGGTGQVIENVANRQNKVQPIKTQEIAPNTQKNDARGLPITDFSKQGNDISLAQKDINNVKETQKIDAQDEDVIKSLYVLNKIPKKIRDAKKSLYETLQYDITSDENLDNILLKEFGQTYEQMITWVDDNGDIRVEDDINDEINKEKEAQKELGEEYYPLEELDTKINALETERERIKNNKSELRTFLNYDSKTKQNDLYSKKEQVIEKLASKYGIEPKGYHTFSNNDNKTKALYYEINGFGFHIPTDNIPEETPDLGKIDGEISSEIKDIGISEEQAIDIINSYLKNDNVVKSVQQPATQENKQQLNKAEPQNSTIQPNNVQANKLPTYKQQMFDNNARAINSLIKQKNTALNEFDKKIKAKQDLLLSKKDKTTKAANLLRQQITSLIKQKTDIEAGYTNRIDILINKNASINKLKKQVSVDLIPTRGEVQQKIINESDLENFDFDTVKKKNSITETIKLNATAPLRVAEKVFGKETAQKINDFFIKPIKSNEAERIRFLNKERQEIADLGIAPKSEESAAVQMYGEGEVVDIETGKSTPYTLTDLKREFPQTWEKIKHATEVIKEKYHTYLVKINEILNEMGYDSIPERKDYFRHFEEITDLFEKVGIPTKADLLPTDINGLTAGNIPGKNFFANALKRTGKKTSYDAIKGIDGYLEGASNLIYHTRDIQGLRTLDKFLRTKYGQANGLDNIDSMTDEQRDLRIKQVQEGHLSNYVAWLTEYTNNLAGKNALIDRGAEGFAGRQIYKGLNLLKKQVGSNLTGYNINSALSNFMSIVQALPQISKKAFARGLIDTITNVNKTDNFIDKVDFLTTRFGSEKLSKEIWEKMQEDGQIFMKGTDYFTANVICRSKYYELKAKGYSEAEALSRTSEFADRLMAGRGKGDLPNLFNSKTLGFLTQFKLEELNAIDNMFHDNFNTDYAKDSKSKWAKENPKTYNRAVAIFILGQLYTLSYLFNKGKEKITGYGGMFDPFGTIEKIVKTMLNDELSDKEKQSNIFELIVDQIPFANYYTGGGRVPTIDAFPNIAGLAKGETKLSKEGIKLLNILPPTGGGQIRKTSQGISTLLKGGDYYTNSEGKEVLRFPVDLKNMNLPQKIGTTTKAVLFGKNSLPTAKDWINNGFDTLTPAQTRRYREALNQDYTADEFMEAIRKERARNSLRRQK